MRLAPFAVLAASFAFSGCHAVSFASQPFDVRRPQPSPPAVFTVDWRVKLVGPQLWESNPREPASPAVDPDTGRVIALTRDGYVRSINEDGKIEWEVKTLDPFVAGATVKDGIVYVPGGDGILYALRARDGSVVWKYDSEEQLATGPLVTEHRVYVASQGSTLFAVDRDSGKWLWQYRRDLPSGFMIQGVSAPTLSMGTLYIGFADGYVVALDPETGEAKWERSLSGSGTEFLDVDTTPIIDDAGRLIVASYKQGVFGLNADTGEVEWRNEVGGITHTLRRGEVIVTSGDEGVGALLAENGKQLWFLRLPERSAGAPVFVRGMLVLPIDESLLFVDPATGAATFSWDPGRGVTATPTWGNQHLYVLSNTGWLYALRLTGGLG
ncbi:MAG: PQQ-binding-like beta-propeller repeat protein [Myxococcaceae bacterium]|nr:PQQ-binding-like beta-propeller repeat protein [Myxococcaceae bacterium]